MTETPDLRGPLALELLKLFPKSVRDDITASKAFRTQYDFSVDSTLSLNGLGIAFRGSELFAAIRTLVAGSDASILVKPISGAPVELSIERGTKYELFLTINNVRHRMPSFWMMADNRDSRLAFFEDEVAKANLPTSVFQTWKDRIERGPLTEDEADELAQDLDLTPQSAAAAIRDELKRPEGRVSVAVPRVMRYYRSLVGERGEAINVEQYAFGNARAQIQRLMSWDFKQGFAQCLLFCACPALSALIDISEQSETEVQDFFTWLAQQGDRFSQVAGIEVGIRHLRHFPQLEPVLVQMLEAIRDEDSESKTNRASLAVNLLVFVDGELSRIRLFTDHPPFWRRLAAIAQASILERELIAAGGVEDDTTAWLSLRAEHFYMQSLADLRQEPRSIPDLISAKQFKIEFLVRARLVGLQEMDNLPEGSLRTLLLGDGEKSLATHTAVPTATAPGPAEGGIESNTPFPEDLLEELRKPKDEGPMETRVFASVVNFSLAFRFDKDIVDLVANMLRKVKYRLVIEPESEIGFSLIMGLAIVAASARHKSLADEVRILARVLGRRGVIESHPDGLIRIALVACASRSNLDEWCNAVGDWLLEIANGELDREQAVSTRSHLHALCHAVPELWPYVAKVDAALAAISY